MEELGLWIIGGLLSVLVALIGFGGRFLIDTLKEMSGSINKMSNEISCLNQWSRANEKNIEDVDMRVTGVHGIVKDIDTRVTIIETEHKIFCK
jgi:hypothetical protein